MKTAADVLRDLNDQARREGRFLAAVFWEVPRAPGSLADVPLTPAALARVGRLDAMIARLRGRRR